MILDTLAALAAGYFLGGLPTAALAARWRGRDIFRVGSGNMGAMNTARNLGFALGALVFSVDVAKGAAAAALGGWLLTVAGSSVGSLGGALAAGVGATAGHAWSPYVGFRGGKALATIFGAALLVAPIAAGYALALIVGLTLVLRRATTAAILALTTCPFLAVVVLLRAGAPSERAFAVATGVALMAAISIVKHVQALRREGAAGA